MRNNVADGRKLTVVQQILLPESHRIHVEFSSDEIHLRFVGEKPLGISRGAHMSAGNFIGVNDLLTDKNMGDAVRSGGLFGADEITLRLEGADRKSTRLNSSHGY